MRQHEHDNIMVSICCITFNHEKYIADAIESFLMQDTTFSYEILIHDDASTDQTATIIRKYEAMYPHIIRAVYQTVNQYSLGVKNSAQNLFPIAKGKYIALCEGDDYWIDSSKLQIQVEYMESNPSCTLCFHGARVVTEDKQPIRIMQPYSMDRQCSTEDVICKETEYPTASKLFPAALGLEIPRFYYDCPVGDVPTHIFLTSRGYAYYINKVMSAYRTGVGVSWTTYMATGDRKEKLRIFQEKMIIMYEQFNEYTHYQYDDAVIKVKHECEYLILVENIDNKSYVVLKQDKYLKHYMQLKLKRRIAIWLNQYVPVYEVLQSIYNKLKGIFMRMRT